MVAPYLIEKLCTVVDPVGVSHEEMQHTKLGGSEINFVGTSGNPVRSGVKPQAGDLDDLIAEQGGAPAYYGFDSRKQLAWGEGLGDVIVRSGFEPRYLVRFLCTASQHDDRNVFGALIRTKLPGKTQSSRVGKNPIEKHQIRQHLADGRYGLGYAGRAHHLVSGTLQVDRDQFLGDRFVFDYKYRAAHDLNGP